MYRLTEIYHNINRYFVNKKIIFSIVLLTVLLFGCKQQTSPDYIILFGNVTNMKSNKLIISDIDGVTKDTIKIHQDGSFKDTLHLKEGEYTLNFDRNGISMYLKAGNEISLSFNAEDIINTLLFSGNGFEISKYIFEKEKKQMELKGEHDVFYALNEASFVAKLEEIKLASEKLLNTTENIPEDFKVNERRNIQYNYLNELYPYEYAHKAITKQLDFKVSKDFLSGLDTLDFDIEDDFLFLNSYRSMVFTHYALKINKLQKSDSLRFEAAFFRTCRGIQNETIRNGCLFGFGKRLISKKGNLDSIYQSFMAASTNSAHKNEMTKMYNTFHNSLIRLAKGQVSPKFFNYKNHVGGTSSLEDLKGKYVYIDIWATWCGPCKKEIPFLKEVEKSYHNKNIEFVSISIDQIKDYEKWKKMVIGEDLGGIQLFADDAWNSKFIKDYSITGIPRFILLDPQGNILDSNAPRPSDEKLIALFDELVI